METSELKRNLERSYDRHARERDQTPKDPWKTVERELFLAHLRSRQAATLLEVGAGPGHDALFFSEHGLDVTCIDMSKAMVSLCRDKGLAAYQMDLYDLRFPPARFDAVWSLNCLLHVPKHDLGRVLRRLKHVLKPSGLFYLGVYGGRDSEGVWDGDNYQPKRYFSFHTDEAMQAVVGRHFEILYFKPVDYGNDDLHFQSMILQRA